VKLRPYHNPENVDESKVPDGWRFLYAHEAGRKQSCACHMVEQGKQQFQMNFSAVGNSLGFTYIVPVTR